jgi:transglutaminase-like putative cysteine protease
MKPDQQVPRNALVWIIISLFTLVAPHAERLPLWVLAVYLFAAGWRIMVYQGRWSFPGRLVKTALIVASCSGIYLSYGSLIGLEPTVALLLTAFALKLIELHRRKDAYVLLFLGYFICITEFLFSQDLLVVLYSLLNVVLVTTGLVALHRPGEHQFNRKTIRLASILVLQSLPLMLVLFFLFPRIGPLWTVPIKSHTAKTGVSDFMRPGDISRLGKSDEVAFRVQFDGEIPPQSSLYWRGLVFSRLEEGAWRSLRYYDIPAGERRPPAVATQGEPLGYQVIMAPTQQNWLYSLRYARSESPGIMSSADYLLFSPAELEDERLYRVQSWPDAVLDVNLSDWRRETDLRLPAGENPQTLALAAQLRASAGDDAQLVDAVLAMFSQQAFGYTLEPPLLPSRDQVDAFLFQSRLGFCEHFAAAFVTLMRAAGVPARVVAGYQGGEINPVNRTVIVHQFDAHAWAEVWLEGEGWVRVDPTAAVSPERIEWGLEQAMQGEGNFLRDSPLSPLRYRSVAWVNSLRLRYDALTWRWQSWVVGFNREEQFRLLNQVFDGISARKFMAVLLVSGLLILGPVAFTLLRKRRRHALSETDRCYLRFCDRLAGAGVRREAGEPPQVFAARAARELPAAADSIQRITGLYVQLAYAMEPAGSSASLAEFRRAVRQFQPPGRTAAPAAARR